jgi:hypothetical protein
MRDGLDALPGQAVAAKLASMKRLADQSLAIARSATARVCQPSGKPTQSASAERTG